MFMSTLSQWQEIHNVIFALFEVGYARAWMLCIHNSNAFQVLRTFDKLCKARKLFPVSSVSVESTQVFRVHV